MPLQDSAAHYTAQVSRLLSAMDTLSCIPQVGSLSAPLSARRVSCLSASCYTENGSFRRSSLTAPAAPYSVLSCTLSLCSSLAHSFRFTKNARILFCILAHSCLRMARPDKASFIGCFSIPYLDCENKCLLFAMQFIPPPVEDGALNIFLKSSCVTVNSTCLYLVLHRYNCHGRLSA